MNIQRNSSILNMNSELQEKEQEEDEEQRQQQEPILIDCEPSKDRI